jgi:predicted MPP superfamily phosphohydrolase
MKISRYELSKYAKMTLVTGAAGIFTYLILKNELNNPEVERINIPIRSLAPSLAGFRIVQISDIHMWPIINIHLVRKTVKLVNALQPDLIVITGDFVTRFISAIYHLAPELGKLQAHHGVFASLGNHDLWVNAEAITNALNSCGVCVLINQGVPIYNNGELIWLAGIDDAIAGNPDLNSALTGIPADCPVVLLGHEPDPADEVSLDGRVDLMLTGHSHGGQIRFPVIGSPFKAHQAKKYDKGLYDVNGMWLYVNRGIGVITGAPLRLKCPPEISEFTLVPQKY